MRLTGQGGFENRGVIGFSGFAAAVLNAGQFDEGKDAEDDEHHAAQNNVGKDEGVEIQGASGFRFLAEEEEAAHGGREDVGAGVERLRHRQAPRRAVLRAEHGDVRIGGRFNARQAGGENEQRQRERPECLEHQAGRNEQKRPGGQHHQPHQDAPLVADATNQQRRRQGHEQIRDEDGRLDEARLRLADVEDVLEMLVQHIQHGMAKPPDEKQGGDHEEREQQRIAGWFHASFNRDRRLSLVRGWLRMLFYRRLLKTSFRIASLPPARLRRRARP